MANSFWKRVEKSAGYKRGKLFLKRLIGRELWLKPDIGLRTVCMGGWWFHADTIDRNSIVYSLGVGDDIGLDRALIEEFDLVIHAFDPTPATIDWLGEAEPLKSGHFCFYPWAITARDGTMTLYPRVMRGGRTSKTMYTLFAESNSVNSGIEVPAFTIESIMSKLGHRHIDLLKMDIEGAEFEVLYNMLDSMIRPRQLLVEFHHRFPGIGVGRTAEIIDRLRIGGYRIVAISETGREVSFLLE